MNLKYEGAEMEVLTRANTNDEQPGNFKYVCRV